MPYTRTWDVAYESTPAGGDQRSIVDDRIRELKLDTRERMDSLVTSWGADPVVAKPEITGAMVGKELAIAGSGFVYMFGSSGNGNTFFTSDGVGIYIGGTGTHYLYHSLTIPATAVLTSLSGTFVARNSNFVGTTAMVVQRIQIPPTGTPDVSSTVIVSLSNLTIAATTTVTRSVSVNHVIAANYLYALIVILGTGNSGSPSFFGAKLLYDIPNALALR